MDMLRVRALLYIWYNIFRQENVNCCLFVFRPLEVIEAPWPAGCCLDFGEGWLAATVFRVGCL
jgi:hypothetical protein